MIESAEMLRAEFALYLSLCENHTVQVTDKSGTVQDIKKTKIPTLKNFWCVHMGCAWQKWETLNNDPAYAPTCSHISDMLEGMALDALINGEGNSTGLIFELKARYGYTDKPTAKVLPPKSIEVRVHPPKPGV